MGETRILKAFVSSTFEDMKLHRAHVITSLRKAGFYVDPMEDWTAIPDQPKEFAPRRVDGCDLCVLLVGYRRGHVPQRGEQSITQLEYAAAIDQGIDVLVFMLDEKAPWYRDFDDRDKDPQICLWRSQLAERHLIGFFNNEPESLEIQSALCRWVIGRMRAENDFDRLFKSSLAEILDCNGTRQRNLGEAIASLQSLLHQQQL